MEFVGSESFGAIKHQTEQVRVSELSSEFQYFTNNAPLDIPDGPDAEKKRVVDQNLKNHEELTPEKNPT